MMSLDGLGGIGSKIGGVLNSGRFQGINDLVGRAGNFMQTAGGGAGGDLGTTPAYQPQSSSGLGGISQDISMAKGAPVKFGSNAPLIPGGRRPLAPGNPYSNAVTPAAPGMSNSGAPVFGGG